MYENSFPAGIFFNLFMDTKSDEIFNIFNSGNNGGLILNDLKQTMIILSPKILIISGINGSKLNRS
jgi:hypothetical protein